MRSTSFICLILIVLSTESRLTFSHSNVGYLCLHHPWWRLTPISSVLFMITFMSTGVALRSSHLDALLCAVTGPEGVSWCLPLVNVPMADALLWGIGAPSGLLWRSGASDTDDVSDSAGFAGWISCSKLTIVVWEILLIVVAVVAIVPLGQPIPWSSMMHIGAIPGNSDWGLSCLTRRQLRRPTPIRAGLRGWGTVGLLLDTFTCLGYSSLGYARSSRWRCRTHN